MRFSLEHSKKGYLSMIKGINLSKTECPKTTLERMRMKDIPYASTIGSIMYAMIRTRSDVSQALTFTSRYQSDPGEKHWMAAKAILKYLRRTKDEFLIYGEGDITIRGYTDASFQSDKDDFKSQSGFIYVFNGRAVC